MTRSRIVREVSKTLSANDLGLTGGHQAGILVPKQPEILQFFPTLDEDQFNPRCEVSVLSPETGQYLNFWFIHYNNSVVGSGTRNEYRLTHMTGYLRELGAGVGDTLTFITNAVGDVEVRLVRQEEVRSQHRRQELAASGWSFRIVGE